MDKYHKVYYEIRKRTVEHLLESWQRPVQPFADIDDKIDEFYNWLVDEHRECLIQLGYIVEE